MITSDNNVHSNWISQSWIKSNIRIYHNTSSKKINRYNINYNQFTCC